MPEDFELLSFLFLAGAVFIAAFIDSIAGGGGLISLPAFIAFGLPTEMALGTNKLAASFSTVESSYRFAKSGNVNWGIIKRLAPFSMLGAIVGVKSVLLIDKSYLTPIIFVCLILVLIYTCINKKMGSSDEFMGMTSENIRNGRIMAFALGFYDGFLGPGTGSFLIFLLIKIFKFNFIKASGNAKLLNLASNMMSMVLFVYYGKIVYFYALSAALVMILGAKLGSKMAITKGSAFIKPVFLIVTAIVTIKMGLSFL